MKNVFVGLSGGVDSAVSAALLQRAGYHVTGVFIKIWQPEFLECTWKEDRLDAMRVAASLGIPFKEVDLSQEYKERVVKNMLAEYAKGHTPNPDVLCNERIKFGDFAGWAFSQGAEYVATGHYARTAQKDGRTNLLRGLDPAKDQSYFLHRVDEQVLARSLFPIGGMKKSDVRARARTYSLPNFDRKDSQGLCFVGDITMPEFLQRFLTPKPGSVLDMQGNVIGRHKGAFLYTVGQRHGFVVHTKENTSKTHYVVSTDTQENIITVSESRADAARKEAFVEDLHWVGEMPALPFDAEIETHYQETPIRARIEKGGDSVRVVFSESRVYSPGQSLVVYDGERCLGGGVIR